MHATVSAVGAPSQPSDSAGAPGCVEGLPPELTGQLHFRVAVHESSHPAHTPPVLRSPGCAPGGRLRSEGRAYFDRKLAEGKTRKEALRSLKRRVSDAIYARLQADARTLAAREGNRGTALTPARPAHTPSAGSSDKPLPGLTPPYDPGQPPA